MFNVWQQFEYKFITVCIYKYMCASLFKPLKGSGIRWPTFRSVQCHPGLTYIFNFWHSGTLALSKWRVFWSIALVVARELTLNTSVRWTMTLTLSRQWIDCFGLRVCVCHQYASSIAMHCQLSRSHRASSLHANHSISATVTLGSMCISNLMFECAIMTSYRI